MLLPASKATGHDATVSPSADGLGEGRELRLEGHENQDSFLIKRLTACTDIVNKLDKSALLPVLLFGLSGPHYVSDYRLQLGEDDLVLGHHVDRLQMQQLGPLKRQPVATY